MENRRRSLLVGVTGSIGSGKSLASAYLAALGARVIEADDVAKELLHNDPEVREKITAEFGPAILDDAGQIDRRRLADRVFNDTEARLKLNSLIHPPTIAAIQDRIAAFRKAGAPVIAITAALFYLAKEAVSEGLDEMILVKAGEEVRLKRLTDIRGMSPQDAKARMAAAAPDDKLEEMATIIVENNGSPEELKMKIDDIWKRLIRGEETQ